MAGNGSGGGDQDSKAILDAVQKLDKKVDGFMLEVRQAILGLKLNLDDSRYVNPVNERVLPPRTTPMESDVLHHNPTYPEPELPVAEEGQDMESTEMFIADKNQTRSDEEFSGAVQMEEAGIMPQDVDDGLCIADEEEVKRRRIVGCEAQPEFTLGIVKEESVEPEVLGGVNNSESTIDSEKCFADQIRYLYDEELTRLVAMNEGGKQPQDANDDDSCVANEEEGIPSRLEEFETLPPEFTVGIVKEKSVQLEVHAVAFELSGGVNNPKSTLDNENCFADPNRSHSNEDFTGAVTVKEGGKQPQDADTDLCLANEEECESLQLEVHSFDSSSRIEVSPGANSPKSNIANKECFAGQKQHRSDDFSRAVKMKSGKLTCLANEEEGEQPHVDGCGSLPEFTVFVVNDKSVELEVHSVDSSSRLEESPRVNNPKLVKEKEKDFAETADLDGASLYKGKRKKKRRRPKGRKMKISCDSHCTEERMESEVLGGKNCLEDDGEQGNEGIGEADLDGAPLYKGKRKK